METEGKHFKFINSRTGNAIYYYTVKQELDAEQVKKKLEAVKTEVAVSNGVFFETIYWEEIKEE